MAVSNWVSTAVWQLGYHSCRHLGEHSCLHSWASIVFCGTEPAQQDQPLICLRSWVSTDVCAAESANLFGSSVSRLSGSLVSTFVWQLEAQMRWDSCLRNWASTAAYATGSTQLSMQRGEHSWTIQSMTLMPIKQLSLCITVPRDPTAGTLSHHWPSSGTPPWCS